MSPSALTAPRGRFRKEMDVGIAESSRYRIGPSSAVRIYGRPATDMQLCIPVVVYSMMKLLAIYLRRDTGDAPESACKVCGIAVTQLF